MAPGMSVPPQRLAWRDVFEPTPREWGLRGDPYAWFMLRARLDAQDLPDDPAHDEDVLRDAFGEVLGLDLRVRPLPETLHVQAFAFGGMSSGTVDLHYWRDHLLPLLARRAADLRAGPAEGPQRIPQWQGVIRGQQVPRSPQERLADLAKTGNWEGVLTLLGQYRVLSPNSWRPSGTSIYTPLHQAAWHGAPAEVVERLVELGGWRTMRTAEGLRPVDLARQHGHDHLVSTLEPLVHGKIESDVLDMLDTHLAELVEARIRPQLDVQLHHPRCEVLTEIPDGRLWYPVPGMHGGFRIELREDHLYVTSWVRVVGGSGQAHLVTPSGAQLVRRGFV